MYKHASLTTQVTNGCRNDDMFQLGPVRSQSLFQFSRSVMRILYIFSYSSHVRDEYFKFHKVV